MLYLLFWFRYFLVSSWKIICIFNLAPLSPVDYDISQDFRVQGPHVARERQTPHFFFLLDSNIYVKISTLVDTVKWQDFLSKAVKRLNQIITIKTHCPQKGRFFFWSCACVISGPPYMVGPDTQKNKQIIVVPKMC